MTTETQRIASTAEAGSERDIVSMADDGMPRVFGTAVPTIIALVIATCITADLVSDLWGDTMSAAHLIGMSIGTLCSFVGLGVMWRLMRRSRADAKALRVALDSTRTDLLEWRSKASEVLEGLGTLIDRQFAEWSLSSAEREIGLLLLKGLSLKAIAELRETSERTVRQQALSIYRKAGVAGRAELSAFFLEDLLLPRSAPSAEATHRKAAAGAQRG
jgi:DNA-binding CsgD family transcriptional regulator